MDKHEQIQRFLEEKLSPQEMIEILQRYHQQPDFMAEVDAVDHNIGHQIAGEDFAYVADKLAALGEEAFLRKISTAPVANLSAQEKQERWQKISEQIAAKTSKPRGMVVEFRSRQQVIKREITVKAAGEARNLPAGIPFPESFFPGTAGIAIQWTRDPVQDQVFMKIEGGTARLRSMIKIRLTYKNEIVDTFDGKEVAIGGRWSIPQEKAQQISQIEILME